MSLSHFKAIDKHSQTVLMIGLLNIFLALFWGSLQTFFEIPSEFRAVLEMSSIFLAFAIWYFLFSHIRQKTWPSTVKGLMLGLFIFGLLQLLALIRSHDTSTFLYQASAIFLFGMIFFCFILVEKFNNKINFAHYHLQELPFDLLVFLIPFGALAGLLSLNLPFSLPPFLNACAGVAFLGIGSCLFHRNLSDGKIMSSTAFFLAINALLFSFVEDWFSYTPLSSALRTLVLMLCFDHALRRFARDHTKQILNSFNDSNNLLNLVIQHNPIIIWAIDKKGKILLSEGKGLEILGLRPGELVGKNAFELFPGNQQLIEYMQNDLERGKSLTIEIEAIGQWFKSTYSPLKDDQGNIIGMTAVSNLITELKKTDQLKKLIISNSHSAIEVLDLEGKIIYAGGKDVELFKERGFSIRPGESWFDRWDPQQKDNLLQTFNQVKNGQKNSGERFALKSSLCHDKAENLTWWEIDLTLMKNSNGEAENILAVSRNITLRKRTEEELLETQKKLAIEKSLFESVLKQMPTGVIICDASTGKFILRNQGVDELLGDYQGPHSFDNYANYTAYDGNGRNYSPEEWPLIRSLKLGEIIKNEEITCFKFHNLNKEKKIISISSGPIRDEAGNIIAATAVFNDITAVRELTSSLAISKDRLNLALISAKMGTWDYDLLTSKLTWSERCYQIYGLPSTTYVDYPFFLQRVHTDDRERVNEEIQQVLSLETTRDYSIEFRILRESGGSFQDVWIRADGKAYFNPQGEASRFIGTILDITEKKKDEEKSLNLRQWYENVLNRLPIPLYFIDQKTGKTSFSNSLFKQLIRVSENQGENPPLEQMPYLRASIGSKITNEIISCLTPLGSHPFICNSENLPALHDSPSTILVSMQDISKLKKIEDDLKAAVHSRDVFLSIASHELKTPLTYLKLQVQLMLKKMQRAGFNHFDGEQLKNIFSEIDHQVQGLARLVEDMLDISRISIGHLSLHYEKFDIISLIDETACNLAPLFEKANCPLSIEHHQPIWGNWDKFRIEQVFINIFTNAIRYGQGKPIEVTCFLPQADRVQICFADHGIGIKTEDQQRIFNCFERAVSPNEVSGLGLGLYITKNIVELHQGTISVEGQFGVGSTFIINLPINLHR